MSSKEILNLIFKITHQCHDIDSMFLEFFVLGNMGRETAIFLGIKYCVMDTNIKTRSLDERRCKIPSKNYLALNFKVSRQCHDIDSILIEFVDLENMLFM